MNKYEQLIEAIISDNQERAKSLFHSIVVEKSRSIYESLLDAETESMTTNKHDFKGKKRGIIDDVLDDELPVREGAMSSVDIIMSEIANGERDIYELFANPQGKDEEAAEEMLRQMYEEIARENDLHEDDDFSEIISLIQYKLEDEYANEKVSENDDMDDLEDEIDQEENSIDSESDEDMDFDDSGDLDAHEEEHSEVEDRVMDLEAALDELRAEFDELMAHEEEEEEEEEFDAAEDESDIDSEDSADVEDEDDSSVPAPHRDQNSPVDVMREYVEKVTAPSNTDQATNKNSVVAKKNDMGGTTANIVRGGAAETGGKVKAPQELDIAKRNVNKPGGNGADKFFKDKAKTSNVTESARKVIRKSVKK